MRTRTRTTTTPSPPTTTVTTTSTLITTTATPAATATTNCTQWPNESFWLYNSFWSLVSFSISTKRGICIFPMLHVLNMVSSCWCCYCWWRMGGLPNYKSDGLHIIVISWETHDIVTMFQRKNYILIMSCVSGVKPFFLLKYVESEYKKWEIHSPSSCIFPDKIYVIM